MAAWIATGFCLLWLWTRAVGLPEALQGCAWVIVRKAFPRRPSWAKATMPRSRIVEVRIPGHPYMLYARWPASDLHILHTVVRRGEYAPLDHYLDSGREILFLDLGANIGAASRYILNRFPGSRVVAVEPDSANIEMFRKNLEPYRDRVRLVQAAVWNCNTKLVFDRESTQTGTEAGIRLREPAPGETTADSMQGIDIPTLLAGSGVTPHSQIVVKMDVEGSEEAIFRGSNLEWLDKVCCMAIELHDHINPNCSRNFHAAMQGRMRGSPQKVSETVFVGLSCGSPVVEERGPEANVVR
jgi:FkbM family methyltransferase